MVQFFPIAGLTYKQQEKPSIFFFDFNGLMSSQRSRFPPFPIASTPAVTIDSDGEIRHEKLGENRQINVQPPWKTFQGDTRSHHASRCLHTSCRECGPMGAMSPEEEGQKVKAQERICDELNCEEVKVSLGPLLCPPSCALMLG